jgi:hypothetical protein
MAGCDRSGSKHQRLREGIEVEVVQRWWIVLSTAFEEWLDLECWLVGGNVCWIVFVDLEQVVVI